MYKCTIFSQCTDLGVFMLSIWKALILGVIQGATEFLPVSSSGHLVVMQQILGWTPENETILLFDIALHVGTLVSVIVVFYKDILSILCGKNWRLLGYLVVATIPAVIVGVLFKDWFESLFASVLTVGIAWLFTGLILVLTKIKKSFPNENVGWVKSFFIGCAQAIAIIPGVSRSGSTIAVGMFFGIKKDKAARFAFLMSIPAIGGGAILGVKDITVFPYELLLPIIFGMIAAALTGYFCIKWLLWIIKKGDLWFFGVYCLLAGLLAIIFSLFK